MMKGASTPLTIVVEAAEVKIGAEFTTIDTSEVATDNGYPFAVTLIDVAPPASGTPLISPVPFPLSVKVAQEDSPVTESPG